jgi:cytoskeleton protein RodZ
VTRADADVAELPTDPGARLRRQRESEGLTEQQAAERLNLDATVVAALECNDYAALGAPVFARGHLRRYGALLGIPEGEMLGAFDRSTAHLAQPTLVPKSRAETMPASRRAVSPWVVRGACLLLAAAGIAAYLNTYGLRLPGMAGAGGPEVAAGQKTAAGADSSAAQAGGLDPGADPAEPAPAQVTAGPATAAVAGQAALVFEFTRDCWVEVYDSAGRVVLYDLGTAGTQRAVTGAAPLSVTLGDAPGVALSVNGRRARVPAPPSGQTVVRFGVGADGSTR